MDVKSLFECMLVEFQGEGVLDKEVRSLIEFILNNKGEVEREIKPLLDEISDAYHG